MLLIVDMFTSKIQFHKKNYLIDIFKNLYKDRGLPWRDTVRLNLADYGEPDRDEFINYLSELFCQYFQNANKDPDRISGSGIYNVFTLRLFN